MASGGFSGKTPYTSKYAKVLFHKDGETATIDIVKLTLEKFDLSLVITNGKIDAGISSDKNLRISDEPTMMLLGAIPLMLDKDLDLAVIGMGSGITTHTALLSDKLRKIDTIEIEKAIVEGVKFIKKYNYRAFDDKRSHIHIEDAKTFFVKNKKKYNTIISEPSNPWISGISSLFSKEYYKNTKKYLKKDGIMLQWIQQYFMNHRLLASIIKGIEKSFKYCDFYFSLRADMILVMSDSPQKIDFKLLNKKTKLELAEINIKNEKDLYWRKFASLKSLTPFFNSFDIKINSDYFPVLNYGAIKARFLREDVYLDFWELHLYGIPIIKILEDLEIAPYFHQEMSISKKLKFTYAVKEAKNIYKYLVKNENVHFINEETKNMLLRIKSVDINSIEKDSTLYLDDFFKLANMINQYFPKEISSQIWNELSKNIRDETKLISKWINLFKAVSAQNLNNMVLYSGKIISLNKEKKLTDGKYDQYLLISNMLGNIKLKKHKEALKYWKYYNYDKKPDIKLKVIYEYNKFLLKK